MSGRSPGGAPGTISHYRLVQLLGRGGMGEVWLADDANLPRRVAIKLLLPTVTERSTLITRLMREAKATARIDHPAVVTVYEAGQDGDRPYIVMQHLEGETLRARLDRGPLSIPETLSLIRALADALAEVHALGIIHRDLKASNVMMTPRGPKILDFGVARVKELPQVTVPGSLVGTPATMSPEQLKGHPPDNRTDLWSLGVIFYECLTGRWPFEGATRDALFQRILNAQPDKPSKYRSEVDSEIDYIVMKLLRKEPEHRYPRAEDLLADLGSFDPAKPDQTTVAVAAPVQAVPRLAVLPFEVLSADADDAFVAAGLTEDLIVDLTRVDGVRVAGRAEVSDYADRAVPPRTLARELGVDFVLTGSVRRAGNRARISAQVVRAGDGVTLWAERFDRTLEDIFDVQAEVSRRIVDALEIALKPGEREMLGRAPTRNTEAYTLYLKAREKIHRSPEDNRQAERLLQQALDLDPKFALAHAALGECYAERGMKWWSSTDVAEQALACARRAREIEPDLPDAYHVELMATRLVGGPEEVLAAIERVLAKNPDDPAAREWAAWSYLTLDRPEEALRILEALLNGQGSYQTLVYLTGCYRMLGREDDAKRVLQMQKERFLETLQRDPAAAHVRSLLGASLVQLGETEEGLRQAERAVDLAPDDGRVRYNVACAYTAAGRFDDAIAQLQEATKSLPSYQMDWPRRDPDFEPLRDHPEFIRMFPPAEE